MLTLAAIVGVSPYEGDKVDKNKDMAWMRL